MEEKKDFKMSQEMAEKEFERFADDMDLDLDTTDMDSETLDAFNRQKKKLLNALIKGTLVINEKGEAVYTPEKEGSGHKEPITFHERTGASVMAIDQYKKNQDIRKTYAIMGAMTELPSNVFSKLKGVDIKTCEAIFALLMD
jgi:hypothetical protein